MIFFLKFSVCKKRFMSLKGLSLGLFGNMRHFYPSIQSYKLLIRFYHGKKLVEIGPFLYTLARSKREFLLFWTKIFLQNRVIFLLEVSKQDT